MADGRASNPSTRSMGTTDGTSTRNSSGASTRGSSTASPTSSGSSGASSSSSSSRDSGSRSSSGSGAASNRSEQALTGSSGKEIKIDKKTMLYGPNGDKDCWKITDNEEYQKCVLGDNYKLATKKEPEQEPEKQPETPQEPAVETCGIDKLNPEAKYIDSSYLILVDPTLDYNKNKVNNQRKKYGIDTEVDWATEFEYGVVYGKATCNKTSYNPEYPNPWSAGQYTLYDYNKRSESAFGITNTGQNCWCRITGFTPKTGDYTKGVQCKVKTSEWVFRDKGKECYTYEHEDDGQITDCSDDCGRYCVGWCTTGNVSFLKVLFGAVGQ